MTTGNGAPPQDGEQTIQIPAHIAEGAAQMVPLLTVLSPSTPSDKAFEYAVRGMIEAAPLLTEFLPLCFSKEALRDAPRWGMQFTGLDGTGHHFAPKLLPSQLLLQKPGGSLAQVIARAQMLAQLESPLFRAILRCDGISYSYIQVKEDSGPKIIRA